MTLNKSDPLFIRATALKLHGIIAHWEDVSETIWINDIITWEENERTQRSLERRLQQAHLKRFKSLTEFDWSWPKKIERETIEKLMQCDFLKEANNVVLCGPNGVGKSTIACNIAYQAVLKGQTVCFTTAGQLLTELAALESDTALRRRLNYYTKPHLLIIDELGYFSYSNRHADLLFEIISRRYEEKSTLVTTNKPFSEWSALFPNAGCVVSLIDRLVHHAEIINIEADSFRLKEAKERGQKQKESKAKQKKNQS